MPNFRDAIGRAIDWCDARIEIGFSNFLFIDDHYQSSQILRRIFSIARQHDYKSLLIEEIVESECRLLVDENKALKNREDKFSDSCVHRLLFLRKEKGLPLEADDLIGYVVFKIDSFTGLDSYAHVYESVMMPFRGRNQNNYIHHAQTYTINSTEGQLKVKGVLYAQQNDRTFVCAHVALRTAIASARPDLDISYAEMNKVAGITRKLGSDNKDNGGLSPKEMEGILKHCNIIFDKIVHDPTKDNLRYSGDFQRDLYGSIESGRIALLGFELDKGGRHIIPVIGHTFNEDTWVANASRAYFQGGLSYFPSDNWMSNFVIHDDNFGPYLCFPRYYLKKDNFRILYNLQRFQTEFQSVEAEAIAIDYFNRLAKSLLKNQSGFKRWLTRTLEFARWGSIVLRTLLITREQYIEHLSTLKDRDGDSISPSIIDELAKELPAYFWMSECSAPELFSASRQKLGEVLIAADAPRPEPLDASLLLAIRLPELIFTNFGGVKHTPTGANSHTPLFEFSDDT